MPGEPPSRRTTPSTERSRFHPFVLAVALALSVFLLRGAGFQPIEWWKQRQADEALSQPRKAPSGPITVVEPTPLGTDSSVSVVPLALHLIATRLGRNPTEGYAEIGVDARSPQTYRSQALLANGARIEEIYADHVVLRRDGRSAELYIDGSARKRAEDGSTTTVAGSVLTIGGTTPAALATANTRDEFGTVLRISPEYDGDALKGLRVYAGVNVSAFQSLGLEPGDQIISIDGIPVSDAKTAIESLTRLNQGSAINVKVQRGAHTLSLALDGSYLRGSNGHS